MGKTSKIAASYFCILPSDWPGRFNYSIQVKLDATNGFFGKEFTFWQSDGKFTSIIMLFDEIKTYAFISRDDDNYGFKVQSPISYEVFRWGFLL